MKHANRTLTSGTTGLEITEITFEKLYAIGRPFASSERQIVQDADAIPSINQAARQMAADEARTTSDEN